MPWPSLATTPPEDISHGLCTQLSVYTAHFPTGKWTHRKVKPDKGIAHPRDTPFWWVSRVDQRLEQKNTPEEKPARRAAASHQVAPEHSAEGRRGGAGRGAARAAAGRYQPPAQRELRAVTITGRGLCASACYCDFYTIHPLP